jgi:5'-phosphate synthase pdxT subunit
VKEVFQKLKEFVRDKPTFGTCAGAILLAQEVENPKQVGLGAIDIGNSPQRFWASDR